MAKGKTESGRLSVFKGHRARLNRTVFHVLALQGPLTIYDMHKQIKTQRGLRYTRYASVNRRVRFLEESGYIKKIGIKKTKAGFQATIYELTTKTYVALLLNSISLDDLIKQLNEASAQEVLAAVIRSLQ